MDKKHIEKLVAEKIDSALKSNDTPKKFFITENGRGVVDGGDLYNAVLTEVLNVMKVALVDIISEVQSEPAKVETKVDKKSDELKSEKATVTKTSKK